MKRAKFGDTADGIIDQAIKLDGRRRKYAGAARNNRAFEHSASGESRDSLLRRLDDELRGLRGASLHELRG